MLNIRGFMNEKILIKRFRKLKSSCTTKRGNKYLLPPDKKDYRWGIRHFGGCEPITQKRAEKFITKMEQMESVGQNIKGFR